MGKPKKRARTPNRREKELMTKNGLKWKNWLVDETDNDSITVISKNSGIRRTIEYGT